MGCWCIRWIFNGWTLDGQTFSVRTILHTYIVCFNMVLYFCFSYLCGTFFFWKSVNDVRQGYVWTYMKHLFSSQVIFPPANYFHVFQFLIYVLVGNYSTVENEIRFYFENQMMSNYKTEEKKTKKPRRSTPINYRSWFKNRITNILQG